MGKKIRLLLDRTTGKAVMVGVKAIAVHSTDELRISTTATLSQSEYDALATKVVDTLYLISGTSGFIKAYLGSIPLFRMSGTKSVTGRSPIVFSSIDGGTIVSLVRYGKCEQGSVPCVTAITQLGKCEQNGTPTPSAPVDIVCNNGAIKVSPNLANMVSDNIVVGKYINNSGVVTADTANFYYATYIPVTPGGTYTMATSSSIWYFSVMQYDSSKNFLRRTIWGATNTPVGTEKTFDVGADCAYIRFGSNMRKSQISESDVLAVNWMLTQTATAQDFRPYGEIYTGGTHPGQNLVDLTAVTDDYYYDQNGVYTALSNARLTDYIPVKSRQKYTVYVKAQRAGVAANVRCNLFDSAKVWKSQPTFSVNSGFEAVGVVTPSENGYLRVSANYAGTGAKADWSKLQIVRGEYTLATMPPYEPYTEIPYLPETLTVRGANLLDPSTSNIKIGQQVTVNGEITSMYPNNWRSDYIPVVGGKTYAFWGRAKADNTISAYNRINWYTANKTHISPRPSYTVDTVTVGTAPSNAAFALLSCSPYKSDAAITRGDFDLYNWMFAEASAEIPYQPYTEQTVNDIPMLLGVGDYKDEDEIISGLLTHKIGIKVLDGTESWTKGTVPPLNYYYGGDTNLNGNTENELMCNQFAAGTRNVPAIGKICARNARNGFLITPVDQTIDTEAKFKQWLAAQYAAGTPVIVLYPLATETTEQTTAHPELTNGKYTSASAEGNVNDINVTVTRGVTSTPTVYNPIPVICNNGEVTGQGATGTPEALTVRGKNLFDKNDSSLQYSNRSIAATEVNVGYWFYADGSMSLACPCLPNTQYTVSGINSSASFFRVATIDVDTLPGKQETYRVPYSYIYRATQSEVHTFVTPSTAKWIIVQVNSTVYDSTLDTILIEKGSTATAYEPYVTPQTATVVDLLQVGDVKDEQDIITGEVARRCAACLYDGTQEVGDTYISSTGGKDIGAVIVYPLDTPATEQVTPQPLDCHSGTNIVESNVSDAVIRIDYPE